MLRSELTRDAPWSRQGQNGSGGGDCPRIPLMAAQIDASQPLGPSAPVQPVPPNLSAEQQLAVDCALMGGNIFITGMPVLRELLKCPLQSGFRLCAV